MILPIARSPESDHAIELWIQKIGSKEGYTIYAFMRSPQDYNWAGRIEVTPEGTASLISPPLYLQGYRQHSIPSAYIEYLINFFPELIGNSIKKNDDGRWILVYDRVDKNDIGTACCLAERYHHEDWMHWLLTISGYPFNPHPGII